MLPIHFHKCANSVTHHFSEKQVCQPSVIVLICTSTSKGHIQRLICCKNCHQQIHSAPKSSFQDTPGTVQVFNVTVSTAALNTVIYHQQLNVYDINMPLEGSEDIHSSLPEHGRVSVSLQYLAKRPAGCCCRSPNTLWPSSFSFTGRHMKRLSQEGPCRLEGSRKGCPK